MALTVRVQPADPKKPRSLRLTIAIPAKDLNLENADTQMDVIVAQHGADGRDLATFGDVVRVVTARSQTLLRDGLLVRREVPLQAGASSVRVVVFDRGSGRLGAVGFAAPK